MAKRKTVSTDLAEKMTARANTDHLPEDHDLRIRATAFEHAAEGYFSNPQAVDVRKFMGCWARARRAWCDYTGEPLV